MKAIYANVCEIGMEESITEMKKSRHEKKSRHGRKTGKEAER